MDMRRVSSDFNDQYPDGSISATEAAMNLVITADLLRTRIGKLLRPWDVTPASGLALGILADADEPIPPNQIAERMILTRATMTGLIDSLERRGYVTRTEDPTDRRVRPVEITEEGRRVAHESRSAIHNYQREWFEVLSERQRATLLDLLGRLGARLQEDE